MYAMRKNPEREWIGTTEAARLMGKTPRRVQQLCAAGRIAGAEKRGRDWYVESEGGKVAVEPHERKSRAREKAKRKRKAAA